MTEFWNARFAEPTYAYGKEPNQFFREQLQNLAPGKILFPAEGEGRNAVFAAQQGFETFAFDSSKEGLKKARFLANTLNVDLNYSLATYETATYPNDYFDVIVLVFAHMPDGNRKEWHQKMVGFLKPGGTLILEGFSKDQLAFGTGGPPSREMLFSIEEIKDDFSNLNNLLLKKEEIWLNEGRFHYGKASVIRGVFIKQRKLKTKPDK